MAVSVAVAGDLGNDVVREASNGVVGIVPVEVILAGVAVIVPVDTIFTGVGGIVPVDTIADGVDARCSASVGSSIVESIWSSRSEILEAAWRVV